MKAAKSDAKSEIDAYKSTKATELKKFQDEFVGTNKKAEADADTEVKGELESIKKTAAAKKDDVIKLLVKAVGTANPELPTNVKKLAN